MSNPKLQAYRTAVKQFTSNLESGRNGLSRESSEDLRQILDGTYNAYGQGGKGKGSRTYEFSDGTRQRVDTYAGRIAAAEKLLKEEGLMRTRKSVNDTYAGLRDVVRQNEYLSNKQIWDGGPTQAESVTSQISVAQRRAIANPTLRGRRSPRAYVAAAASAAILLGTSLISQVADATAKLPTLDSNHYAKSTEVTPLKKYNPESLAKRADLETAVETESLSLPPVSPEPTVLPSIDLETSLVYNSSPLASSGSATSVALPPVKPIKLPQFNFPSLHTSLETDQTGMTGPVGSQGDLAQRTLKVQEITSEGTNTTTVTLDPNESAVDTALNYVPEAPKKKKKGLWSSFKRTLGFVSQEERDAAAERVKNMRIVIGEWGDKPVRHSGVVAVSFGKGGVEFDANPEYNYKLVPGVGIVKKKVSSGKKLFGKKE